MKKKIITLMAMTALLLTACAAAPSQQPEEPAAQPAAQTVSQQPTEAAEETPSEETSEAESEQPAAEVSAEEASDMPTGNAPEEFLPQLPVHAGIWEARTYDQTYRYYEFDVDCDGRTRRYDEGDAVSFTYEDAGDELIVFRTENGEETAHYRFGEDGKHLVLTFSDRQEELIWVSHGTLEDSGGLGLMVIAENITPEGCRLILRQAGGYPTGEIVADDRYQLLCYDAEQDSWGWKDEIQTGQGPYTAEKDAKTEIDIDWSEEYGSLAPGRYFLCFRVRDIRNPGGDWDAYMYRAEIVIAEDGKKAFTGGFRTYFELPDGTWECDGLEYKYRLEIKGRMPNAQKNATFVYLSNREEITFEQAFKAAGLSSSMADYFPGEEAVFVDWIVE